MPDPIDYQINVADPFKSVLGGFSAGMSIADSMRERKAKIAAEERARKIFELGQSITNNPNATAEDYAKFSMLLPPEQAKGVRDAWDMMNKDKQQNALNVAGNVFSALNSGNKDVAVNLLKQQAEAAKNTPGQERQAQYFDTWAQIAEVDPDAARINFGTALSMFPGGDKLIESATKIGEERRKEELQPGVLEKQAADLGLTRAQTNKVMMETKKLGADVAKAALELEALQKTGGVDPEKNFNAEEKLRKEYVSRTKVFNEVSSTYENLKASASVATGPGDIALITGFMKMLDPGSVVRETEFATARDTAGLYERLKNNAQKLQSGQLFSLDSKQRREYIDLAEKYYSAAKNKADLDKDDIGVVVKNYGLNPANVFGVERAEQPTSGARASYGAAAPQQVQSPARTVTVDY